MGIESFIRKVCVQTAVYWGNPKKDGFGTATYDPPVEIKCRWGVQSKYIQDKAVTDDAKQIDGIAEILVTEDVELGGYLYLGYLIDIESYLESDGESIDPTQIDGAYEIIGFKKIPMVMSTREFVRTAFI